MLTQQDLRLANAFDGLHRRRHLYAVLYALATAIILMWLLGLGGPFAVTVGPYVFTSEPHNSGIRIYWAAPGWMQSPMAAMTGWEAPTRECEFHRPVKCVPGCVYAPWPLWLRFCVNVMLLLPLAAVLYFSLLWFVREFMQAASEPSMDPPTLSRDAALAVAFSPALCIGVHIATYLLLLIVQIFTPLQIYPLYHVDHALGSIYGQIPPLLHWPIWFAIAFVTLRLIASKRRGIYKPLRGLFNTMVFSVVLVMLNGLTAIESHYFMYFSPVTMFLFFACLLPLFWSLGAVIALAYRWPRLRRKMMGTYCVRCGYDMRGSFAVGHHECPECGEVNTPSAGLHLQEAPHANAGPPGEW